MVAKFIKFVKTDIWRMSLKNYSPIRSFFIKQFRIVILAIRGYIEDKCKFRASALTYFTLLSIVPVIAMMFGIAKGFGLEEKVKAEIMARLQGQQEIAEKVIEFSTKLLESASGGWIAGIGIVFIFWAIIKVLSNIEHSFNDIWGVKKPRSIGRKFSDYLSVMLVCPILLVMASSATVMIGTQIRNLLEAYPVFQTAGPVIFPALRLLPYATIWVAFTFIFIFMPNTKVKFTSGLLAGIVAGTLFQVVQIGYVEFQIGVTKASAVYGSFAALPLFLIWLQISWLVVLFGAELSFAHQNVDTYEFEQDSLSVSNSYKKLLSLMIAHKLIKNFCAGEGPLDAPTISQSLEIPIRLVRQILYELNQAGVICETRAEGEDREISYQPARDAQTLTVKYVVDALEHSGNDEIPVVKSAEYEKLAGCLGEFGNCLEQSSGNIAIKDI